MLTLVIRNRGVYSSLTATFNMTREQNQGLIWDFKSKKKDERNLENRTKSKEITKEIKKRNFNKC